MAFGDTTDTDLLLSAEAPDGRKARVLVIDDSSSVRRLVSDILAGPPLEADVVTAADGASGLKIALSDQPPECVVCDVNMPNVDGMLFVRQLRQAYSTLEMPVVFLTVRENVSDKVAALRAGASDFLVKPVEHAELTARVETHVRLARMHAHNQALISKLKILVDTDPLTGIANRRSFMRRLQGEFSRSRRMKRALGLLLIDVDHFKSINDRFGHQVGDSVLVAIAEELSRGARKYDLVARVGGEEFAVLLPEVKLPDAKRIAERICQRVERCNPGPPELERVTVSIGVGHGPVSEDDHADALYKRADTLLYDAKGSGRNRVARQELAALGGPTG